MISWRGAEKFWEVAEASVSKTTQLYSSGYSTKASPRNLGTASPWEYGICFSAGRTDFSGKGGEGGPDGVGQPGSSLQEMGSDYGTART